VSSFLNSSNLFAITVLPVMQADRDLERNETESRVDHVSGHVEDPGDQAASPLHAQYSSLYSFYLHPMAVATFLLICSCAPTSLSALPFPYILSLYSTFISIFGAGVYINFT
jgi:VIT1/CCC1 family predicted Fe2+/Mn2+ transporter